MKGLGFAVPRRSLTMALQRPVTRSLPTQKSEDWGNNAQTPRGYAAQDERTLTRAALFRKAVRRTSHSPLPLLRRGG